MKKFIVIVLALGLMHTFLWAKEEGPRVVQSIEIKGNKRIETAAIRNKIGTKAGHKLDPKILSEDVKNLFHMGYFQNVSAFLSDSGVLTFQVREKTVISKIEFVGNDKVDKEDLEKEIQIKPFTPLDKNKIREDLEKIRKLYDRKGFYLADVDSKIVEKDKTEAVLQYVIKENKKVLVRRISFIGNSIFSDKELKGAIRTKEKGFLSFLSDSGTFQEEILQQDRQILREFYGHRGYIRAKIGVPRVQLTPDKRSFTLTFTVDEGPQYKVGKVDLEGDFIKDVALLRKEIKLKEGEIVDTNFIQQDVNTFMTIYGDAGYAYANVIPRDTYDEQAKIVNITYNLQPGQKVFIERIEFRGNISTRDKVLRREMALKEGDLFSTTKLKESRQNIERMSLYEDVHVNTLRGSADDRMTLVIEIKEKPTGTFSIGAGFNTLESFQIIGRIEKKNLFGYGVDISLDARLGGKTQAFNLQYRDEYFLDSKWGLTVNAFNVQRQYSNFDLESRGGTLGFDYPLYVQGLRRVRAGLTYGLADEILSNIQPTVEALFKGGITSSVTGRLTHDTRNRVFEPSKGTYQELTEQVAGGVLGGDNTFSKTEFDARWFIPMNDESNIPLWGGSVVAFHFNLGYVAPLRDGERVPLFERFFPGGILSLRGFPIRSLGPDIPVASSSSPASLVASDFTYGGNKQAIFNAEYIFPIIRVANIKGVVFFDIGNAFDNGESMFTLTGQRQSAGFGVRWFSPIGPLRFEWGFPLDKKQDESRVVFDFTIGSLF